MNLPHIDVEEHFGNFLETYGASVLDKILSGPNKPINADYIFHEQKVIAELKLLKKSPFSNKDFQKSFQNKKREWVHEGLITAIALDRIEKINQLPKACYRDVLKLYERSLKNHIQKANDQIKSVKEISNLNDYKGLLFLCSDGNYLYEPGEVKFLIEKLMADGKFFKSIHTVLYFTVNMVTTNLDDRYLSRHWVRLYRAGFERVNYEFLRDLFDKWVDYYNQLTGLSVEKHADLNEESLNLSDAIVRARFVRPLYEE